MSKGAYTYEPGNITEFGKDRMRFELGDTMVEGLADTTALTDEEIQAAIDAYPNKRLSRLTDPDALSVQN